MTAVEVLDCLHALAAESCEIAAWALASNQPSLSALAIADAVECLRLRASVERTAGGLPYAAPLSRLRRCFQ